MTIPSANYSQKLGSRVEVRKHLEMDTYWFCRSFVTVTCTAYSDIQLLTPVFFLVQFFKHKDTNTSLYSNGIHSEHETMENSKPLHKTFREKVPNFHSTVLEVCMKESYCHFVRISKVMHHCLIK